MKAVEELKNKIIQEAIKFYLSNKKISIKECASMFDMSPDTLSTHLKKTQTEDYYHHHIQYDVNESFFDNINTEEKAYWLGFMTADGCIFKNRPMLRLCLSTKDHDHVVKFKNALEAQNPVTIVPAGGYIAKDGTRPMASSISIQNKQLYNALVGYGFTSRKSCNEKPVNLPENLIRHYIRGIFDGDGWISFGKNYRDLGFGMGEEILIYIKDCFEKYANIKSTYQIRYFKTVYRYRISDKKEILKALEYMYKDSTIYLERKYNKYLEFKNAVLSQEAQKTKDNNSGIKLENPPQINK